MVQINWTEKSSKHLEAIFEYIAHDSKVYAGRFVKSIIKSTFILKTQIFAGRVVPEIGDESIREIFYRDYRIIYKVMSKDSVEILAVYHGAMNIQKINT